MAAPPSRMGTVMESLYKMSKCANKDELRMAKRRGMLGRSMEYVSEIYLSRYEMAREDDW